jgi:hypothetical protein
MTKRLDSTKWLRNKLSTFEENSFPSLYTALLHIYLGSLTLEEIAETAGISQETFHKLRLNPRFMRFVDTFKKELSEEIREDLIVESYQFKEYDSLAADFSLYDEMFQFEAYVKNVDGFEGEGDFLSKFKDHIFRLLSGENPKGFQVYGAYLLRIILDIILQDIRFSDPGKGKIAQVTTVLAKGD